MLKVFFAPVSIRFYPGNCLMATDWWLQINGYKDPLHAPPQALSIKIAHQNRPSKWGSHHWASLKVLEIGKKHAAKSSLTRFYFTSSPGKCLWVVTCKISNSNKSWENDKKIGIQIRIIINYCGKINVVAFHCMPLPRLIWWVLC
jgi:hypothetical protein